MAPRGRWAEFPVEAAEDWAVRVREVLSGAFPVRADYPGPGRLYEAASSSRFHDLPAICAFAIDRHEAGILGTRCWHKALTTPFPSRRHSSNAEFASFEHQRKALWISLFHRDIQG